MAESRVAVVLDHVYHREDAWESAGACRRRRMHEDRVHTLALLLMVLWPEENKIAS